MNHRDDAHLLSGAYALDAVTPEEAALVEAAMRESEDLHSEVVGLADTAVALGLSLPPVAPPPALRARLLDAIETLPQETAEQETLPQAPEEFAPVAAAATGTAAQTAAAPVVPTAMPSGEHSVPARRRRRRRVITLIAAGVTAVVLFSGGLFVQRSLFENQTEFTQIQTAADVQHATGRVAGGGIVTVSWSKAEHRTSVVLTGVKAPSGRVLQLWSVRGSAVTSAGLYEPQSGQNYALLSGTPNSGETLAVSVEPEGGSTQPTTKPIVALPLEA